MHKIFVVDEWNDCLDRLVRHHADISGEVRDIIVKIRQDMSSNLVPSAEEKAAYGKTVKADIRRMWAMEHEISDIQTQFVKSLGEIDLQNLTDDIVEDIMQQSKPLQIILMSIRNKQSELMDEIVAKYNEKIANLKPLRIPAEPRRVDGAPAKDSATPSSADGQSNSEGGEAPVSAVEASA